MFAAFELSSPQRSGVRRPTPPLCEALEWKFGRRSIFELPGRQRPHGVRTPDRALGPAQFHNSDVYICSPTEKAAARQRKLQPDRKSCSWTCRAHGWTRHAPGWTRHAPGCTRRAHGWTRRALGWARRAHGCTRHAHGCTRHAHGCTRRALGWTCPADGWTCPADGWTRRAGGCTRRAPGCKRRVKKIWPGT